MSFLNWGSFVFLCCIYFTFQTQTLACEPSNLLALKEFASNLTKGSILTAWSNESSCCQWDGVVCGDGSDADRVIELILAARDLNGPISGSLGKLTSLRLLNLSWNHLGNGLPLELSNLQSLVVMDLSYNMLVGPISGSLIGLKSLRLMNISNNLLNGNLLNFDEYPQLEEFSVRNNSFLGPIPSCGNSSHGNISFLDISLNRFGGGIDNLKNCSRSLRFLHLDYNMFSGHLPEFIYEIPFLKQLTISGNNFSGELSARLSKLSRLRALVIAGNRFSGSLPNVFGNLTELERLVACSNLLSGTLPTTLSLCSQLNELDLRNNSLFGTLSLNFTAMIRLGILDLASNRFTGSFPDSISSISSLKILSLAKNDLIGQLPEKISNLRDLTFLSLSNNRFKNLTSAVSVLTKCINLTTLILTKNFIGDEMPKNVTGFENLKIFAIGNCGLEGEIPIWLLNCKRLQVLDLSWNRLNGHIPSWIGSLENLLYLDLSNNSIAGEIPRSLTNLKSLIYPNSNMSDLTASFELPLYVKRNKSSNGLQYNQVLSFPPSILLNNNMINGTIHPEIGNLKQLHVLDLSKNNLVGAIPSLISEMGNLEILDLSFNGLTGPIPFSLTKLTFLSRFSVAYNNLIGEIPNAGQFLSFPNSSFEGNHELCGAGSSRPCTTRIAKTVIHPRTKFDRSDILGMTIGLGAGVACLLTILAFKLWKKNVESPVDVSDDESCVSYGFGESKLVLFQNSDCKHLTVGDLLQSTNGFNQSNIIGCGGFGLVYRATLPNGLSAAIKKLSGDCGQIEREFRAEVEALSRAQHENLVSLQGYCRHGHDRFLIYSYMENGSLDYWLHERAEGEVFLDWDTRLKIAIGAGRGLAYLHKACKPNIVHRDVKSSNILLGQNFEAHLADFGLSRLLRPHDTHVTTDLVGTLGYIPPEYSQALTATFKGDVYSFGVVLLELVTGRRPVEVCRGKSCRDLVSWVFEMRSESRHVAIVDSSIWDEDRNVREVLEVLGIACKCLDSDPRRRPGIDQVVSWLEGSKCLVLL